ncbi:MAG TPA: hypothetical protein VJ828_01865 [Lacipirellulaceae bacterium]|nr:hypothetical protein [Lacipirellulaceae bacterium]
MSRQLTLTFAIILAIGTAWAFSWQPSTAQDQAVVAEPANESVEVLARGPVHEAFAEPVNLQSFDPLVIEVAPPEPIEELPPDQKPEGENVEWIPGYWAWDDDRQNFLWVSGVWRDIPPGQRWVPGYWSVVEGGWCWTAGFWISDAAAVIEYLPDPPETLEVGPQIAAPSEDHVWVPGIWRYQDARYVWRPGYWTVVQPGWVWVPARYIWCPSGYAFVDGYWDYPIEERGVLFAPVYYHEPVYRHANYYYTPTVVISTEILTVHLFARPRYCHYYFGDYYAPRYREIGIEPWLMFPRVRGCYDPLFHYYGWHHRRHGHGDWHRHLHDRYEFFAQHEDYRPAHTYAGLRRQRFDRVRTGDINIDNSIQNIVINQNNLAVNLNQYVQNVNQDVRIDGVGGESRRRKRFARVNNEERRQFAERARDIRGFQARRSEVESQTTLGDRGDRTDRGDRGQVARGDRRQVARGDRGARRSLSLADLQDRRGNRDDGQRLDRRAGRGRDRASVAADVPPTPEQTAGGAAGPANAARDATAGAGRNDRRSRALERPGRQDVTHQRDITLDATRDTIIRRDRARAEGTTQDAIGQSGPARDRQRERDAVGRRGRDRDNRVELGRVGPQIPGALNQDSDRAITTRTPRGATTPGRTPITDPAGAGSTTNQQLDAARRGRGSRGDGTRRLGDLDATDPSNNAGGLPAARQRGRTSLPGSRNPSGVIRPEATVRTLPDGLSGNDAARNRQLRGRGDENRSQNDPFRQRGLDSDAFRSRGQFGGDDTGRNRQAQRQDAFRGQLEQQRGTDESNRSNLEQLLNQQREAARQRDTGSDTRGRSRQQFDRGRSGFDFSQGRGNEQSRFGDAGQRDSQARRGSFGPFPGQQGERQSMDRGQPGGPIPGFDPRSGMQRTFEGQPNNDMRRQFSPGARQAFGGRGGGDDGAEAFQRMNRGGRDPDASQQFNRGGGGRRSFSRQEEQSPQATNRAERRGRSGDGDQRGGRGDRRGRDRDDDDD